MSRRANKYQRPLRPLRTGGATSATKSDGRWIMRTIGANQSDKDYRCPGCDGIVVAGTPHVVAWPAAPPLGSASGLDFRRHWHTACWNRRR